jgi:hypothetical protein
MSNIRPCARAARDESGGSEAAVGILGDASRGLALMAAKCFDSVKL